MFRNLRSKPCGSARRDKAAGGGGESSGTRWVPRTGGQRLLGCNRLEQHKLPNAQVCSMMLASRRMPGCFGPVHVRTGPYCIGIAACLDQQRPTCARICLMKSTMSRVASRKMLTWERGEQEVEGSGW